MELKGKSLQDKLNVNFERGRQEQSGDCEGRGWLRLGNGV